MAGIETFTTSTKGLVTLAFVIGIGMTMVAQLTTNSTVAANTTTNDTISAILTGISQFGTWIGLIVLIIVGVYLMKSMNKTD